MSSNQMQQDSTADAANNIMKQSAVKNAVPLSLSSLAHIMCLPPGEDHQGVIEGLLSVVHHTLAEVTNHAPAPIQATPWNLMKLPEPSPIKDLPYQYVKYSYLYLGTTPPNILKSYTYSENWASPYEAHIVGRIALYYASSQHDVTNDDDEEMIQALFIKAVVQYRSQPSKGSLQARKQEELSLTSFGNGSVDDNVKLGALSSLHDEAGKYVLEVTSVRNKTYRYDVSDAGMACVTVMEEVNKDGPPLTRLELALAEGNEDHTTLKPLSFPSTQLEEHFLVWDTPISATALPSQQTLLLNRQGMFINGRLMKDAELPPALFGFNLDGVPAWHGRIQNYEIVKQAYATLWQEVMIDARLLRHNIASTLLDRLMNGVDEDEDEDSTNVECLESLLMASPKYDPVGICAKALATRFAQVFGKAAVPCLLHEVEWFQNRMGHKTPVVVPQRVINILRRGGYFDPQRETNEMWCTENVRPAAEGNETKAVEEALKLLRAAGCEDAVKIMFVKLSVVDPVKHKCMCRYGDELMQYHVNEAVWSVENPAAAIAMYVAQEYPDGNVLLNLMSK